MDTGGTCKVSPPYEFACVCSSDHCGKILVHNRYIRMALIQCAVACALLTYHFVKMTCYKLCRSEFCYCLVVVLFLLVDVWPCALLSYHRQGTPVHTLDTGRHRSPNGSSVRETGAQVWQWCVLVLREEV